MFPKVTAMKNELLYSFFAVFLYFILNFALFAFLGNELSRNVMLILNIPLIFLFVWLYYKTPNAPNAVNFAVIMLAVTVFMYLLIAGTVLRQGLSFLYSVYFWIPLIENLATPFIYEALAKKKPPALPPAPTI